MTEDNRGDGGAFDAVLAVDPGGPRLRVAVVDRDGGTIQTAVTRTPPKDRGVPGEAMGNALTTRRVGDRTRADVARARLGEDAGPLGARALLPSPAAPSPGEGHS